MKTNVIITPTTTIIVFNSLDSKVYTFEKSHINYDKATELAHELVDRVKQNKKIKKKYYEEVDTLFSISKTIEQWTNGDIIVTPNGVTYKGKEISQELNDYIFNLFYEKRNYQALESWSNFIIAINRSNSYKVINRLFLFLEKEDLSIDKDGNILAWRTVNKNFRDKHTNSMDNSVGKIVEVPRESVDDNDNSHCSHGLHVCSAGYLPSFASNGDPIILVKISPEDIISIPLDYNGEKVRVCKFEVLQHVGYWGTDFSRDNLPSAQDYIREATKVEK